MEEETEWPPRVWHGVLDPVTGERFTPTWCEVDSDER